MEDHGLERDKCNIKYGMMAVRKTECGKRKAEWNKSEERGNEEETKMNHGILLYLLDTPINLIHIYQLIFIMPTYEP